MTRRGRPAHSRRAGRGGPGVISRFLAGKREIRTATVDKIAEALGLRLVEVARPKARGRRPSA